VNWGEFHKDIYALCLKFALCPHLFEQIYSNLASCTCALRSPFCIFSQILGAVYALRPVPIFYEIHPWFTLISAMSGVEVVVDEYK
jgi:hypothetical protein